LAGPSGADLGNRPARSISEFMVLMPLTPLDEV